MDKDNSDNDNNYDNKNDNDDNDKNVDDKNDYKATGVADYVNGLRIDQRARSDR